MDAMSTSNTNDKVLIDILLDDRPAANADVLQSTASGPDPALAAGWDSFEVWRKFIKEARDKRDAQ